MSLFYCPTHKALEHVNIRCAEASIAADNISAWAVMDTDEEFVVHVEVHPEAARYHAKVPNGKSLPIVPLCISQGAPSCTGDGRDAAPAGTREGKGT